MALFKKKGEVIDLTELQRKGTLQRAEEIAKREGGVNEGKVIDLTKVYGSEASGDGSSGSSGFGSSGDNDFLGSLAGIGAQSSTSDNENSNYGTDNRSYGSSDMNSTHLNYLKNKIEDIEYKIDRLIEKLERIEGKIGD